jgi:hypothetical protein
MTVIELVVTAQLTGSCLSTSLLAHKSRYLSPLSKVGQEQENELLDKGK